MSSRFFSIRSFLAATALVFGAASTDARADVVDDLRPFLEAHCISCHGPDEDKGDLRLDGELDEDTLSYVFDVIDVRDMPPKKAKSHPSEDERKKTLDLLAAHLAASTERPIALRRLNRFEYENTIHDLLGIDTPLADLLPEDGSTQGFDNVAGGGLSISSILMERYLEAADVAFDATIRRVKPLAPETRRAVAMEEKENIDSVKKNKGGTIQVANSFVKFAPGWPPVRADESKPIEDGLYRCRVAVWPHDPGENRTLSLAVYTGPQFGPAKLRFEGMFDVTGTAKDPRIIEFTSRFKAEEAIHLVPWIYPEHVTWRDEDFEKRPGIAIQWLETYGPLDQDFPSKAQRQLFGDSPTIHMEEIGSVWMRHRKNVKSHDVVSEQPKEDAERIIRNFAARAFRRPVDDAVVQPFVDLTLTRLEGGRSFEQAVRAGVTSVLCAPQFLLLNDEPEVDDFTLASRLSYFLWSSMPDDELLELAQAGKLSDPKTRAAQVDRLLADAKAERFIKSFTGQWLDLREIEFTTPDAKLYPEFDTLLQESMLGETRGFFRHLLTENLSIVNFVDSDFTVVNQRLADHYGIPGVKGHENFRVAKLPEDSVRGGVLAQASVLKVTANGTTTSPVLRGVWFLENILGQPAPPPPPGVPAVEPDIRGATSIREQLDLHSSDASCARCHTRIDPPGFALEDFDPIGGFRDRYRSLGEGDAPEGIRRPSYKLGPNVESDGEMPGSSAFSGFVEFRRQLAEEPDPFIRAFTEKMVVYATGRPITAADGPAIDALVARAKADGLGLRDLIKAVVENELFTLP